MADALGIPAYGVLLARRRRRAASRVVVADARRKEVYWARVRRRRRASRARRSSARPSWRRGCAAGAPPRRGRRGAAPDLLRRGRRRRRRPPPVRRRRWCGSRPTGCSPARRREAADPALPAPARRGGAGGDEAGDRVSDTPIWLDAFPHDFDRRARADAARAVEGARARLLPGRPPRRRPRRRLAADHRGDRPDLDRRLRQPARGRSAVAHRLVAAAVDAVRRASADGPYLVRHPTTPTPGRGSTGRRCAASRRCPSWASRCCSTTTGCRPTTPTGLAWVSDHLGPEAVVARPARRRGAPAGRATCCTGCSCGTARTVTEPASW